MKLGKKIYILRRAVGYSQELLAEKSNVSLRTVQRIETEKSEPRFHTLKSLAKALNVPIDELIIQSDNVSKTTDNPILKLMNLSVLLGLIIPLMNLLLPLIIWIKFKSKLQSDLTARKIISFQIIWTLMSLLVMLVGHFLHYKLTGQFISGNIPVFVYLYLAMLLINVFFTLKSAQHLTHLSEKVYAFVPALF